ncbi:MAG: hypothetical protein KatS3mg119_1753 [Rhodothalassiaceae bacterium]|nr:MAG: hypothetical protein KatS3mg119_1753 [Rhodothalassiaceae bacterium]
MTDGHLRRAKRHRRWRLVCAAAVAAAMASTAATRAAGSQQGGQAPPAGAGGDGAATALMAVLQKAQDPAAWRDLIALLAALPDERREALRREICGRDGAGQGMEPLAAFCATGGQAGEEAMADAGSRTGGGASAGEDADENARALTGVLDLGASLSSGDTDERALSARLKARQELGGRWRHQLAMEADWGRSDGITTQKRLVGDHRLFYGLSPRLTVFQFLRGEYDPFSGFDYRITESIGIGYDAIGRPGLNWHLEGGPGIRFIALADSPAMRQEPIARLSSELTWTIAPDWTLENDTGAFLGGEGSTLENTIALEARINGSLFGRISFNLRYDTKELAGDSKLDSLTKFSIGYRF